MRYQPDSFFYGFPNCFRLLFRKMSLNVNIASFVSWSLAECFVRKGQMRPLFLSFLLRSHQSRLIYYQIDIWKTPWGLIITNVCHVSVDIMELICNIFRCCSDLKFRSISQPNVKNKRSYFAYKNNIWGKNELWLSTWESREWKHPKFIKGKLFNLIAFLICDKVACC